MKHRYLSCATAIAALLVASVWAADTYELDTAHSSVNFSISHMVISKVKGRFTSFTGSVTADPEATNSITAAQATIAVKSIDTSNAKRDEHLRSADFFDAEKHPTITFETKSIEKQGDQYIAKGTFTMHGVSKEFTLPFKVNGPIKDPWGNTRLGIEARTTLNRSDYGLTWNKALETGGVVVGDEVEIEIQAEAVKKVPQKD